MLIVIDYDGTYTQDPALWDTFIKLARCHHTVICATMRYREEGLEVESQLADLVDDIVFTGRKAKRVYLENEGYFPDVWIDDSPMWILQDSI